MHGTTARSPILAEVPSGACICSYPPALNKDPARVHEHTSNAATSARSTVGFPHPRPCSAMQLDRLQLHHEPIDIAIPGTLAGWPPRRIERITCAVKASYASSPWLQQVTTASFQNRASSTAVLPPGPDPVTMHVGQAVCISASLRITSQRPCVQCRHLTMSGSHRATDHRDIHPLNPHEESSTPLGASSRRDSSRLGLVDVRQH